MKVCIIGAGIIGCASAYALARAGHEVVLLDAAPTPAQGASLANGAQLSYSYVQPLASPATLRSLPALLMDPHGPMALRLRMDVAQWMWCLRFIASCTDAQSLRGTQALLTLAQQSRCALEHWMAEEHWECAFARNGKLVLCPDAKTLAQQRVQVTLQAALGCDQQVLDTDGCIAREPALAATSRSFVGGVWTPSECVVDPKRLAEAMVCGVEQRGGCFHGNTRVVGWRTRGARVTAARISVGWGQSEDVEADAFVLATGADAARLCKPLGVSVPVYPVKGYSLTLPFRPGCVAPQVSVTDLGIKTVFAPLAGKLRVAAMAEIVGHDTTIEPVRVEQMLKAVDSMFPGVVDIAAETSAWAGLRPATPTSIPVISAGKPWTNLWLNVGHGALGLTLAAGSAARLLRQMVQSE